MARIELSNGYKDLKEDYNEIINCINQAICCGTNFIEVTEKYITTQFIDEYQETKHENFQKICININHIVSF
jgi:hypothetical protein